MAYGLRLKDASSNSLTLTPNALTVISAGRVTLSNSLNGDNTYGTDIALPTSNIPVANLAVIVTPVSTVNNTVYTRYIDGGSLNYSTFYADSAKTYYSRNDSTGVMTAWSAGNRTANSKSTWNPILSVYPIAFWDKMGATTFTNIRLFAATAYLLRETHNDTNIALAGTASGSISYYPSGGIVGTSDLINNNNTADYYLGDFWVTPDQGAYTSGWLTYEASITFASSKTVNRVDLTHYALLDCSGGSAGGTMALQIYYNSTWNTILTFNWGNSQTFDQTDTVQGLWTSCSAIRVQASCYGRKSTGYSDAYGEYDVGEIKVWATDYTDAQENKIVYSIGNNGIAQVDYLIALKNYNY